MNSTRSLHLSKYLTSHHCLVICISHGKYYDTQHIAWFLNETKGVDYISNIFYPYWHFWRKTFSDKSLKNIIAVCLTLWNDSSFNSPSLGIPIIRFTSIHTSGQSRHSSIIQAVFMVRLCATCKQSVKVLITIQEKRVRKHVPWIISIWKLGFVISHPLVIHTADYTSGSNDTLIIWNEHLKIYYAC